ncbi:phenylalanine--tRNA ligase subunit beta [Methylocapsa acidiphila]|uniref:Phenylalanine--tRNA ligase beta subunit n=1 Tax=Methylocapsa acidiphila TaxID=133552 RepID=Q2VNH5_METAI|nr:phenylalanine--tRNA ligase subunit beta [Methylocapsa acidiphila]CAJ01657.1 putative phenylalanyl-trna synthetase, beta chain, pheT [Methylocapsa acidiphila]
MKFTLSWLKDHLETDAGLLEIVETLTKIGLEVERVEDPSAALRDFVTALVVEAKPHPNADRLQVCLVDAGGERPIQVVCGAPNARTGLKSVFALPGAYIPGKKVTLGKGVIRGVESNGMLCSGSELGLSDDHDGILELPESAPVGAPYAEWAGLADPMVEINLLPNRPDAMGVQGVARDLAAAGLGKFLDRTVAPVPEGARFPIDVKLDFAPEDAHLAPVVAFRLVRGVRNGPSPEWMQRRLKAIGLRPINALVDITNYFAFDRARPLHVFDAAKVQGDIVIRRARPGEQLRALDGRTYALDSDMVVIADEAGVESLAGIMGGEASGCDEATTSVLIESALWDPVNIARTGRKLGINSDARYRFERGVDPAFCLPGLDLATAFVLELCGGVASFVKCVGKVPQPDTRIAFPWSEVARLAGLEIEASEMAAILERLGFELAGSAGNSDRILVKAPSFRPDIEGKADLVEEIVRIAGLERVAARPLPRASEHVADPVLTPLQKRVGASKRALAAGGLVEAVTWSFVSNRRAELFGGGAPELALANPIAPELSDMRPSLLPGLIAAAQRNADRGHGDLALFEVGQIFKGADEAGQRMAACGVRRGSAKSAGVGRHWSAATGDVDCFDAKADAMALLAALGAPVGGLQVVLGGPAWFHPGRSAILQFGPKNQIGAFGEIHPRVLEELDAQGPLVGFELVLNDIPTPKSRSTKAKPKLELSEFMPVLRDFAFLVDRSVQAADIVKAALAGERTLVSDVGVFDVYEGKGVPEGKKSVAISVALQPREKTLTESEIDAVAAKIIAEVGRKTGATLRG